MWIRSQDRKRLVNTNYVNIRELDILHTNVIDAYCNQSMYLIGEYSTKEKAMKVMDMIQNAITGTRFEFTDIVRDCELAGIEIHNVFNMPKDEEVE